MKQKFTKIENTDAFVFTSEKFVENNFQSRKRKKNVRNKYNSVEEYKI